jgi:hypothetical protein
MTSLDDLLDGIDSWSKAKVHPPKPAPKPAAKKPDTPSWVTTTPPKKKELKKRRIDQFFEKMDVPEEKKRKAKKIIDTLMAPEAPLYVSPLGDEPLIVTAEQCELAIKEIMGENPKVIAVDCEGVNLGRLGTLCLVQVATTKKPYLFDIVAGGAQLFGSGLRQLLEDPKIIKIMHDCRLDSDALFHEHKVALANVFDTQVAYAVVTRGKGQSTPLPVSLNTLLRHYAHGASNEVKDLMKQAMSGDPEYWLKRPMDQNALKYARQDVTFLCTVQRQMDALLTVSTRKTVVAFSNQYIDQVRKQEQAVVREKPDPNSTERFIPKYGIREWDMDTHLNLERNAGRKKK